MKRLLCTCLALAMLLSFSGCSMPVYEDTNGEDNYSLQTITDEDIVQGISTTKVMSSTVTVNRKTVCKAKTMSGVESLWEQKLENETLEIVVSCEITKGNAKLVLVVDDEIVHTFSLNEDNQRVTLENVTGEVSLKLAGEDAGYAVSFEFE